MTVTREVTLWCDYPGCQTWTMPTHFNSVQVARREAKKEGWRFSQGRGDLCPEHSPLDVR